MSEIGKLVGERIRNIRKQRKLSQEELGQLADLHPKYISSVERAEKNVSLESIEKIAHALKLSLEELFRNINPSSGNTDELAIRAYNLLIGSTLDDQHFLIKTLEELVEWKK